MLNTLLLAKNILRKNYSKLGILAGASHFADLWVRDCCFAGFGALSIGDTMIVKTSLETIIKYIRKDGKVPLRIGRAPMLVRLLTPKAAKYCSLKAAYTEDKVGSEVVDSNLLFVILFAMYIIKTEDAEFLHHNFKYALKAMDLVLNSPSKDGLIIETKYGGWMDSIKKTGCVLYTNVLYYRALFFIFSLCKDIKRFDLYDKYILKAVEVSKSINTRLWNGRYYKDFTDQKQDYFDAMGNSLALLFGVVPEASFDLIYYALYAPITTVYHKSLIYTPFRIIGLADYQNGMIWPHVEATIALAAKRINKKELWASKIDSIHNLMLQYNTIHEVYEKDHHPVDRFFYKSEKHFSWALAMYILALEANYD